MPCGAMFGPEAQMAPVCDLGWHAETPQSEGNPPAMPKAQIHQFAKG